MAEIINKSKEENLHQIMEVLEGVAQRTEELQRDSKEVHAMSDTIDRLTRQCEELDARLPKGSKIYEAETPSRTRSLNNFGKVFTAAWRLRQYGVLEEGYERASGAPGQAGDATAAGGVTVPTVTHNEIARIIGEMSIIRNIGTTVPMASNSMVMPTRDSGPSVSWANTQGNASTDFKSSVVMTNPSLTAKTLMAIDEVTSELTEDSVVALEPFFAAIFAEAIAQEENQQAFSSSTPFTGVAQTSGVGSVNFTDASGDSFGDIAYADLVNLQFAVDSKVVHKGAFVMHSSLFKEIVNMQDSQNRPLFSTNYANFGVLNGSPDQQTATPTMLLGRPCYLTDTMPSAAVAATHVTAALYGDFSKFAFGDRKALSVEWSDQVYFEHGNLALRVRERIALKVLIASAFAKLMTLGG